MFPASAHHHSPPSRRPVPELQDDRIGSPGPARAPAPPGRREAPPPRSRIELFDENDEPIARTRPTSATAFAPAGVGNVAVGFDLLGHALDAVGDRVEGLDGRLHGRWFLGRRGRTGERPEEGRTGRLAARSGSAPT